MGGKPQQEHADNCNNNLGFRLALSPVQQGWWHIVPAAPGNVLFLCLFGKGQKERYPAGAGSLCRTALSTVPASFSCSFWVNIANKKLRLTIRLLPPVKRAAGDQLRFVQMGLEPAADWKPIRNVGQGVMEIRIKEASGQYRIIYVAKFADAVHVLHAFQKKTQKTSGKDLDLARKRYKEIGG